MPVSRGCRKASKTEFLADLGCFYNFLAGFQGFCFFFFFGFCFFFLGSTRIPQSDFLFLFLTSLHTHASLHNFSALLGGVMGRCGGGGRVAARDLTARQPLQLAGSRGKVLNGAIAKVSFNQFNC